MILDDSELLYNTIILQKQKVNFPCYEVNSLFQRFQIYDE